jgi:hypothetical protein
MIHIAARDGFAVSLDPAETGGWESTIMANGQAKDCAYQPARRRSNSVL